ncbi:MAG: hypothetical protein ABI837_06520 [Acidobacteriota bacterium]
MASDVIVQRHVPAYDFVFVAEMEPEAALSALAGAFDRVAGLRVNGSHFADSRDERGKLEVLARHAWSLHPRVRARSVASVAGSNVYVSLRISWFWQAIILGLVALFVCTAMESQTSPETLLAVVVTIVAIGAVVLGLVRAEKTVVSALTMPLSSESKEGDEGKESRLRRFLVSAAIIVILGMAILLAPRGYQRYRDARLLHAAFPTSSTREDVRSTLGAPDLDLSRAQVTVARAGLEPGCVAHAAGMFYYFGPSISSDVYCAVYFDEQGRVLCVDHGTFK